MVRLTRQEAEVDPKFYPLMNFMIAAGRDIPNWSEIQSLKYYDNREYELYRGLANTENLYVSERCTSWTSDLEVAKHFATNGLILWGKFTSDEIVFDTTYLADDLFKCYRWQKEVIIKPKYTASLHINLVQALNQITHPQYILN